MEPFHEGVVLGFISGLLFAAVIGLVYLTWVYDDTFLPQEPPK